MTRTVGELVALVDRLAPVALASDWDNVGLLVGRASRPITRVLVALDLRTSVVEAAKAAGCEAILVHHPPLFPALASVTETAGPEGAVLAAAEAQVAVIAAHTNLDAVAGGLNDILGEVLELPAGDPLEPNPAIPSAGLGRIATGEPRRLSDLIHAAHRALDAPVRFAGDPDREVTCLAWCTGAGGSLAELAAAQGAEAYITSDLRYHDHDRTPGLALVDLPHAAVEASCLDAWAARILTPAATDLGIHVAAHEPSTDPWRHLPGTTLAP